MDIGDGDTTRKVAVVGHGAGSGGRRTSLLPWKESRAMEGENSRQGYEFTGWAWTIFMPASSNRFLALSLTFPPPRGNPTQSRLSAPDFRLLDR